MDPSSVMLMASATAWGGYIFGNLFVVRYLGSGRWQLTRKKAAAAVDGGGNSLKAVEGKRSSKVVVVPEGGTRRSRLRQGFIKFWFYGLREVKTQAEEAERVREEAEVADAQVEFLLSLSAGDVDKIFEGFRKDVQGVVADVSSLSKGERKALRPVLDAVNQVESLWRDIRWSRVSGDFQLKAFRMLTVNIPEAVTVFRSQCVRVGVATAWSTGGEGAGYRPAATRFAEFVKTLGSVRDAQVNQSLVEGSPVVVAFPDFVDGYGSAAVDEAVAGLRGLWVEAYGRKLCVEDEFFVEQVAVSYVPDMMRLFKGFRSGDAEKVAAAERVVLEQVALLVKEVERVLEVSGETHLGALESQLVFLKSREELKNVSVGLVLPEAAVSEAAFWDASKMVWIKKKLRQEEDFTRVALQSLMAQGDALIAEEKREILQARLDEDKALKAEAEKKALFKSLAEKVVRGESLVHSDVPEDDFEELPFSVDIGAPSKMVAGYGRTVKSVNSALAAEVKKGFVEAIGVPRPVDVKKDEWEATASRVRRLQALKAGNPRTDKFDNYRGVPLNNKYEHIWNLSDYSNSKRRNY